MFGVWGYLPQLPPLLVTVWPENAVALPPHFAVAVLPDPGPAWAKLLLMAVAVLLPPTALALMVVGERALSLMARAVLLLPLLAIAPPRGLLTAMAVLLLPPNASATAPGLLTRIALFPLPGLPHGLVQARASPPGELTTTATLGFEPIDGVLIAPLALGEPCGVPLTDTDAPLPDEPVDGAAHAAGAPMASAASGVPTVTATNPATFLMRVPCSWSGQPNWFRRPR